MNGREQEKHDTYKYRVSMKWGYHHRIEECTVIFPLKG